MKVDDLEVGKIYKCRLSKRDVLVLMTEDVKQEVDGKETIVQPARKAGKISVVTDDGSFNYVYCEIHDGQLTNTSNN